MSRWIAFDDIRDLDRHGFDSRRLSTVGAQDRKKADKESHESIHYPISCDEQALLDTNGELLEDGHEPRRRKQIR